MEDKERENFVNGIRKYNEAKGIIVEFVNRYKQELFAQKLKDITIKEMGVVDNVQKFDINHQIYIACPKTGDVYMITHKGDK